MLSKYQINRKVGIKIKMISIREVTVKYNSLGVPDSMYKGVIRQTDNYVTRLIIDLTDVPGDISNVGLNVKKDDGSTNKDGLIVCHPIVGQVKKYYVDINNWYTNIPGTLELTVQALSSMNGLTQVFNCSKINFAIEGTAIELDETVTPESYTVLSINSQTGVVEITHESVGDGSSIVKDNPDNPNAFKFKSLKGSEHIDIIENIDNIVVMLNDAVTTDIELQEAIDGLNLEIQELLNTHKTDLTAHGIDTLLASLNTLSTTLTSHVDNDNAHGLNLVKADILALESALDGKLANSHNTDEEAHSDIRVSVAEAKAIAEGKAKAKVFPTKADALNWLASHSNELNVGDNIYIEALNEPDYWWNGSELKELETEKPDLTDYYKKELVYTKSEADNKFVQQEEDKGLSTNDYTTDEKNKLSGIDAGAEVNVQSDWNQTDDTQDDYIKNKPAIPTKTSDLINDSEFITEEDLPPQYDDTDLKSRLSAIEEIIESIDGETDADNVINKLHEIVALLDGYAEGTTLVNLLGGKVDKVEGKGLSTNDYTTDEKNKLSGIDAGAEVNVQSDWNQTDDTQDDYIKNKPAIPTKTSDLINDSEFITEEDLPPQYDDTDLKSRLSAIEEIIESIDGETDADNVINKLHEIVALLDGYAEGTTLVNLLGGKVDKVEGKGLSTNDFTTTEKNKLAGVQSGAQVNIIENIKVNGTTKVITDKTVDISLDNDTVTHLYAGEDLAVHDLVIIGVDGKWYKITNTTINSKMDSPIGRVSKVVSTNQLAMVHIRGKFHFSQSVTEYDTKQFGQTLYLRGSRFSDNEFRSDGIIINGLAPIYPFASYKPIGIWLTNTDIYLLPNPVTYTIDYNGKKLSGINGLDIKDTIPTVPTISTNIEADSSSDTKTASPKAVKTYVDNLIGDINSILEGI